MAEFVDPHKTMAADTKYTQSEMVRALRQDLAAEEEAASLYETHAEMTDDPVIKKVLLDITDEERIHIGEFQRLINLIATDEVGLIAQGMQEVDEVVKAAEQLSAPEQIAAQMGEPGI